MAPDEVIAPLMVWVTAPDVLVVRFTPLPVELIAPVVDWMSPVVVLAQTPTPAVPAGAPASEVILPAEVSMVTLPVSPWA